MRAITSRNFRVLSDFMEIRRFMVEVYEKDWRNGVPAPFWEYALSSSWMDHTYLHRCRVWEEENKIVAFVFYENPVSDVYFSLRPGYEELAAEMVAYADSDMPTAADGGRRLVIFEGQQAIEEAAKAAGYMREFGYQERVYDYERPLDFPLPPGFHFVKPGEMEPGKVAECCWKGFDHEQEEGPWDGDDESVRHILAAPHATPLYPVAIENERREYVCYAGMWWTPENQLAYMEPLCTVPEYRGKGLASAALSELYRRMKPLGATHMTGGDHPFYEKVGFEARIGWTFWKKKDEGGQTPRLVNMLNQEFRGVELVCREGEVLLERVGGYADLVNRIPNTLKTKFASASAGKVFVAVGILQLIEQGRLRFGDTLGDLLPQELYHIDPLVTVEQLLTHTSGVPDYFDESVMEEYEELWVDYPNYKIRHNADLLPLFIHKEMMYPRGERFQYNNTGYVLLAMILEQVSGMDFDVYLRRNIFEVCDMHDTGYYELDRLPANCANNYIWDENNNSYRTNIYCVDAKGTGAGGAFVTAADILRFWQGLASGKLLSPEMVSQMLSRKSGDGADSEEGYYGYGVWIIDSGAVDIPYFQGCDPGVSFLSEYHPEKKITTVLVSNYGDNVWEEMRRIRQNLY